MIFVFGVIALFVGAIGQYVDRFDETSYFLFGLMQIAGIGLIGFSIVLWLSRYLP